MERMTPGTASALSEASAACDLSAEHARALLVGTGVQPSLQERMARIVRTIEADIIPRLVRSHRPEAEPQPVVQPVPPALDESEVGRFVAAGARAGGLAAGPKPIALLRSRGLSVEALVPRSAQSGRARTRPALGRRHRALQRRHRGRGPAAPHHAQPESGLRLRDRRACRRPAGAAAARAGRAAHLRPVDGGRVLPPCRLGRGLRARQPHRRPRGAGAQRVVRRHRHLGRRGGATRLVKIGHHCCPACFSQPGHRCDGGWSGVRDRSRSGR